MTNKKWSMEFNPKVIKELKKLDKQAQIKIINYLEFILDNCDDPRMLGKPLKSGAKNIWRYRAGNYRILCELQDAKMIILVVAVGDRKEIYEKN